MLDYQFLQDNKLVLVSETKPMSELSIKCSHCDFGFFYKYNGSKRVLRTNKDLMVRHYMKYHPEILVSNGVIL